MAQKPSRPSYERSLHVEGFGRAGFVLEDRIVANAEAIKLAQAKVQRVKATAAWAEAFLK